MMDRKPLYSVVRERLMRRIRKGEWKPGAVIPNEFEIARTYRVSQGTARKAIGELANEGILTRHQGRGTFVTEHTADQMLSRFPRFVDDAQKRIELRSLPCTVAKGPATAEERKALDLPAGAPVLRLYRLRTLDGSVVMSESISLPAGAFRSFKAALATDALYDLYQRAFGVYVVRIVDELSAVPADKKRAKELGIAIGTPLLRVERVAHSIDEQRVEWRVSYCHASGFRYLTTSD